MAMRTPSEDADRLPESGEDSGRIRVEDRRRTGRREWPFALTPRAHEISDASRRQNSSGEPQRLRGRGREHVDPAPERDEAGNRIKPHAEWPIQVGTPAAQAEEPDGLRQVLNQHAGSD